MKQHIYYVENDGQFIAIKHGDTGYYKTDVTDQGYCDGLNALGKNTPEQCEAAKVCSMHGNWDKFDDIATGNKRPVKISGFGTVNGVKV